MGEARKVLILAKEMVVDHWYALIVMEHIIKLELLLGVWNAVRKESLVYMLMLIRDFALSIGLPNVILVNLIIKKLLLKAVEDDGPNSNIAKHKMILKPLVT